jgi:hypothetical protein
VIYEISLSAKNKKFVVTNAKQKLRLTDALPRGEATHRRR